MASSTVNTAVDDVLNITENYDALSDDEISDYSDRSFTILPRAKTQQSENSKAKKLQHTKSVVKDKYSKNKIDKPQATKRKQLKSEIVKPPKIEKPILKPILKSRGANLAKSETPKQPTTHKDPKPTTQTVIPENSTTIQTEIPTQTVSFSQNWNDLINNRNHQCAILKDLIKTKNYTNRPLSELERVVEKISITTLKQMQNDLEENKSYDEATILKKRSRPFYNKRAKINSDLTKHFQKTVILISDSPYPPKYTPIELVTDKIPMNSEIETMYDLIKYMRNTVHKFCLTETYWNNPSTLRNRHRLTKYFKHVYTYTSHNINYLSFQNKYDL